MSTHRHTGVQTYYYMHHMHTIYIHKHMHLHVQTNKHTYLLKSGGFLGGPMVEESTFQCRRLGFDLSVSRIPWGRKWHPTPVFLPGKSHGQRSLAGCSPWGCKELDMTKQLRKHACTHVHESHTYTNAQLCSCTHICIPVHRPYNQRYPAPFPIIEGHMELPNIRV